MQPKQPLATEFEHPLSPTVDAIDGWLALQERDEMGMVPDDAPVFGVTACTVYQPVRGLMRSLYRGYYMTDAGSLLHVESIRRAVATCKGTPEQIERVSNDARAFVAAAIEHRLDRLRQLQGEYGGAWVGNTDELTPCRYAAISGPLSNRRYNLTTHETLPDALAALADAVLEGDVPVGVVDLDTGQPHGVHVSTPIVSDIGGRRSPLVPWENFDGYLPAIEPGDGATSQTA